MEESSGDRSEQFHGDSENRETRHSLDNNAPVVLSFDIGIRNLAACALTMAETSHLLHWDLHPLMEETRKTKPTLTQLAERIFVELDKLMEKIGKVHYVLIENQPSRINGAMKSIQMVIFSYFLYKKHVGVLPGEVLLISANKKTLEHPFEIDTSGCKAKSRYTQTKYKSVKYGEKYVQDCATLTEKLQSYKKKDDICDAMLQAIAWMRKNKVDCRCVRNA